MTAPGVESQVAKVLKPKFNKMPDILFGNEKVDHSDLPDGLQETNIESLQAYVEKNELLKYREIFESIENRCL